MKRQVLVLTDSATALALYHEFSEFLRIIKIEMKIEAIKRVAAKAAEMLEFIPMTLSGSVQNSVSFLYPMQKRDDT